MRTHHVNPDRYRRATESGNIGAVLLLRTDCGARSTARAQVDMNTDWDAVDCVRCLAKHATTTEGTRS